MRQFHAGFRVRTEFLRNWSIPASEDGESPEVCVKLRIVLRGAVMNQWACRMIGTRRFNRRRCLRHPVREVCRQKVTEDLESRCLLSAVTIQLLADHDTTIDNVLPSDISNGHGQFIVAGGATGVVATRRGLIAFNLTSAGIPVRSTILDAVLSRNADGTCSRGWYREITRFVRCRRPAGFRCRLHPYRCSRLCPLCRPGMDLSRL